MRRIRTPHLCGVLLALTVVAYIPLWGNGFVDFDDELYVTDNPHVLGGLTRSGFVWAWTNYDAKYWQPLSWLSLQFDAHFFSTRSADGRTVPSAAAFHAQNLFWHGASALLLFGVWQRLTGARWRSFLVAALFALHPMHVESVAWAAERKDVLSVFFGILALWAYLRYVETPDGKRYLGLVTAFLLSILCKPMLMTLPFVLLLLDYWPLRRLSAPAADAETATGRAPVSPAWLVLEKVPLLVLATAIGVVTLATRTKTGAAVSLSVLSMSARLANAVTAYGWYVAHTFWPVNLAVLYPHPYEAWSVPPVVAGAATLLLITLVSLWQARRRPWLITGWLWFVGTLVPVIGLTQGGEQAWADRFTYWPHIGLFVATAWGLGELVERARIPGRVAAAAAAVVLGCLVVLTWVQVGYWRDTTTLWERALAVTEDNPRPHCNLGKYYQDRGRFDLAQRHFAEAVRIRPDSSHYHEFLGVTLLSLGREEEAVERLLQAAGRAPTHTDAWYNLGVARLRQGKLEAALRCYGKVLELEPGKSDALAGMGRALWRQGKRQEAVETYRAALDANQKEADAWSGLGTAYLAQGRVDDAIAAFRQALRCNPGLVNAESDLGVALGRNGQWAEAVSHHVEPLQIQAEGEKRLEEMGGRPHTIESISQVVIFQGRLAFALNRLGDRWAAGQVYRAALARDPHWPQKFTAKAWRLATNPDENFRDPQTAYELVSQAIEAVGDPPASMLDVLAATQAALGQFPDAVRTGHEALDKAAATETTLADSIRGRLQLYEQGKPVTARVP
jgi:tetratricopeptide (TPR) repeat protein